MSKKNEQEQDIKRMANLLKQGATLIELACPVCASPLFKLRDDTIWCAKCEKQVIVVREGETPPDTSAQTALESVEETILSKTKELQKNMQQEHDPKNLQEMGQALADLLENLDRIRKVRKKQ